MGEAPPVEMAITSGLRSTIEGMMKSQSRGWSATLTSAPAAFADVRELFRNPLVLGGDEAERRTLEVLRAGIAGDVAKIGAIAKLEKILAEFGREGADAGAAAHEELGPPRGDDAAADHDGRAVAHLQEYRQISHRRLSYPIACGIGQSI